MCWYHERIIKNYVVENVKKMNIFITCSYILHFIKWKVSSVVRCTIILCRTKKKILPILRLWLWDTFHFNVFVNGKKVYTLNWWKPKYFFLHYLGPLFFKWCFSLPYTMECLLSYFSFQLLFEWRNTYNSY